MENHDRNRQQYRGVSVTSESRKHTTANEKYEPRQILVEESSQR